MKNKKNIKVAILLIVGLIIILICKQVVLATPIDSMIDEQLEIIELNELEEIKNNQINSVFFQEYTFRELVKKIINGEVKFSVEEISIFFLKGLLHEIKISVSMMCQVIIICIFSQILKNLNISFQNKSVGEIGFYITYIVLVLILLQSYNISVTIVRQSITDINIMIKAIFPTMVSLAIMSGSYTSAAVIYSAILLSMNFITTFLEDIMLYIIYYTAILEIVNHLSERKMLNELIKNIKKITSIILKTVIGIFLFLMSLQSITLPMADGLINKTAKYAVNSIPVVGSTLTGVVDTVLACSGLIKNAVGIGAIFIIIGICLIPVTKVTAVVILFKISASILQPLADKRVISCVSGIGDSCSLLLGLMVTVMVLFVASIAILIGSTNLSIMT